MLKGLEQQAIVVETIARLRSHGSWAGETHVQKSLFFLKDLLQVPLDYSFVLYKHGPYSFDLHHDVGRMRAYNFIGLEPRLPYGPSFAPGDMAEKLLTRFDLTVKKYGDAIEFVANNLGNANVRELERYATALFVNLEFPGESPDYLISKIIELKSHIAEEEAAVAVQSIEVLKKWAVEQNLVPTSTRSNLRRQMKDETGYSCYADWQTAVREVRHPWLRRNMRYGCRRKIGTNWSG